ncbi:MAG: rhomboid family intramembrane serine protease, partial [Phycisphaerales bacterium]
MFLPVGTDRPLRRPTVVNHALIVANIAAFMAMTIALPRGDEEQARALSSLWLHPAADQFNWWTLITYQFLHDPQGFAHILGNMLFLFVFGPNVEDRLGRFGYLAFYLAGGVAAGLAHIAFEAGPVIGASGSIAAVTGAYMTFFPRTRIRVLVFFFIIGIYWIPSVWFIGFAIARDFLFQGFAPDDGVARLAHLGGYAFGIGVCLALLWFKVLSREPYDLFSLASHAQRRRRFKELASKGQAGWSHGDAPGEPKRARKRDSEPPIDPKVAEARAAVSRLLSEGEHEKAIEAYRTMLDVAGR